MQPQPHQCVAATAACAVRGGTAVPAPMIFLHLCMRDLRQRPQYGRYLQGRAVLVFRLVRLQLFTHWSPKRSERRPI